VVGALSAAHVSVMRVAALGRTALLVNTIRRLTAVGHDIVSIVTCQAAPEYGVREEHFEALAQEVDAEFLLTQTINGPEAIALLARGHADVAVSVNWISIVHEEACSIFPHGILNAHAGELPRYRGNAPVAWAILQGESRVGISIHRMTPGELDSGPIIRMDFFPLSETTYVGHVYQHLERRVPELFVEALAGLAAGTIVPCPQPMDPAKALRCYPRRPEDAFIDWRQSTKAIERLVRASAEPFSGAYTLFQGDRLIIWRARGEAWPCPSLSIPGQVVSRDGRTGEVGVATADGIIVMEEVGRQTTRCAPATLIKSLRDRLGAP
jgi:methionyl-tRNA formyltransferase